MIRFTSRAVLAGVAATLALATTFAPAPPTRAADHSEAPLADEDRPNDIGDLYAFLDPNDNTKMVIAFTIVGFIVPAEQVNQGVFDAHSRYRIGLNEDADPAPDRFIDITFSKQTSKKDPQTATIILPDGRTTITAPTTVPTQAATAPERTVTTDGTSGVSFFAGVVDDPFFFDIPGFNRFVGSVTAGNADPSQLDRGRDSFAGYDTLGVALSVPVSLLHPNANKIGVNLVTQRQTKRTFRPKTGEVVYKGPFVNVDRMGLPAINTVLVPFVDKDKYNLASPVDDANDVFLADIGGTLTDLGTSAENIGILKALAIDNGDYLYVDVTTQNSGNGGGDNANAGFPNGRRLGDDVVDALVAFVTNFTITAGDHVNGNDVPLTNTFPFFGISQQPRDAGTIDDNTRN
jgi:hypothetical protein